VEVHTTGDPVIPGRQAQLASATENLVANATQFADPDTTVGIIIERRPSTVRITVTNHGPALSPTARVQVWDRFYSTRATAGGTGLGLSIVRSVALGHGGTVGVDCTGGVTAFWFELRA
jgi:signal transduction histidine kinase